VSDFLKRPGANVARLQQDIETSLARAKTSTLSEAASYAPGDETQWADPPPSTIGEALDRLAVAGATNTWPA
jgi:hypothetical protein